MLGKSSKENGDILEPLHVESLFLIEGDVLDEGSDFFVDSDGFQELHEGSLESLIECVEIRSVVLGGESIEFIGLFVDFNIVN